MSHALHVKSELGPVCVNEGEIAFRDCSNQALNARAPSQDASGTAVFGFSIGGRIDCFSSRSSSSPDWCTESTKAGVSKHSGMKPTILPLTPKQNIAATNKFGVNIKLGHSRPFSKSLNLITMSSRSSRTKWTTVRKRHTNIP